MPHGKLDRVFKYMRSNLTVLFPVSVCFIGIYVHLFSSIKLFFRGSSIKLIYTSKMLWARFNCPTKQARMKTRNIQPNKYLQITWLFYIGPMKVWPFVLNSRWAKPVCCTQHEFLPKRMEVFFFCFTTSVTKRVVVSLFS